MNTKFDELLTFPCRFPFKVIGDANPELVTQVTAVLQELAPEYNTPTTRPSLRGNYQSITVSIQAKSKMHLEALYRALGDIDAVKYVL